MVLALLIPLTACSTAPSALVGKSLQKRSTEAGSHASGGWPQASHDARRSGASAAIGPQTGHLRWTVKLEGNVTPGPVIGSNGIIYAASNAGVLHALEPSTGKDVWKYDAGRGYGGDLSTSPAVLADGSILWPGPGALYALSPAGTLKWKLALAGPTSPAVDGDRIVIGTADGGVFGVDPATGRKTWTAELGGNSYGSVALSPTDTHRSYQTVDSSLVALDDGKVAWRKDLGKLVEVSPAVAPDGTVVVGGNAPYERGFSPEGKLLWKYDRQAETYSSPIVTDDGIAYFGDHDGVVTGLEATTGKVLARYLGPTKRPADNRSIGVWTSPVVDARHDVYWGSRSGHVLGVAADGHRLFDLDVGATVDSYPALDDGLLVVGLTDGRLLAIAA